MFTQKSVGYFLLASALLFLAIAIGDWQLAVLVLPIASMFFLTNAFGFPEKVQVELERKIVPSETFGDEEIHVVTRVRNMGDRPLENVEIVENLPPGMDPEKGTSQVYALVLPGEIVEVSMEFKDPGRGQYRIGPLKVRVRDAIGLYLFEEGLESATLAVMPRPERIRLTELRPRHVGPWTGTIPSRVTGVGTEFFSLREYQPGDDMMRVNWKATAHSNQLIVNEMEAERGTDVMLVLDTDVTLYEHSQRELFENAVRAAASMASLLLRQGNRVGLLLQGEERGVVSPGFGKLQERRILYKLASAKPGAGLISTSYIMNVLAKLMLPRLAQVVIISPLLDPNITDGIRQLVAAGYSVIALTPLASEPLTFSSEAERIAFRIAGLERANVLLAIEKVCTLIQWSPRIPLSRRIREARRLWTQIRI